MTRERWEGAGHCVIKQPAAKGQAWTRGALQRESSTLPPQASRGMLDPRQKVSTGRRDWQGSSTVSVHAHSLASPWEEQDQVLSALSTASLLAKPHPVLWTQERGPQGSDDCPGAPGMTAAGRAPGLACPLAGGRGRTSAQTMPHHWVSKSEGGHAKGGRRTVQEARAGAT